MSSSASEACGLDENSGTQKISLLDHVNGFHYNALNKSDNFVIDMDTSHKLQKSLSRNASQRGGGGAIANDRDATLVATSSPRGPSTPEKPAMAAVGPTDHSSSPQVHHQITITTCNIITTPDSKSSFRRNSFKRSSHSWALDPKRVLLFFATLSSMGTILLIYFTLSLMYRADENALDYMS